MQAKIELREKLLKERANFDELKYSLESEAIVQSTKLVITSLHLGIINNNLKLSVRDIIDKQHNIGLYWQLKAEPDLFKLVFNKDWKISLPKLFGLDMGFVSYQAGDSFEESSLGNLMQPCSNKQIIPNIIVLPGLAFSIAGHRLGFGVGHYDKYIDKVRKEKSPIIIGVCFHDKLFEYLPYEPHDIKCNYIITEKTIIKL